MPDQQQITDSKLDQQTSLLRWILGGIGAGILACATWMGSQFAQDKTFLREDVKAVLASIAKGQEQANAQQSVIVQSLNNQTQALTNQTQVMRELTEITRRGEWREVPVASAKAPPE